MKLLEKIKKWRMARNKESFRKKMNRINPNPYEYKIWEHKMWGDCIDIRRVDEKKGTFSIVGWLDRRPNNGDKLIYDVQSGKRAVGYIVNVEYCADPGDMFFADVIPFEHFKNQ